MDFVIYVAHFSFFMGFLYLWFLYIFVIAGFKFGLHGCLFGLNFGLLLCLLLGFCFLKLYGFEGILLKQLECLGCLFGFLFLGFGCILLGLLFGLDSISNVLLLELNSVFFSLFFGTNGVLYKL